jgi:hypothetical protein
MDTCLFFYFYFQHVRARTHDGAPVDFTFTLFVGIGQPKFQSDRQIQLHFRVQRSSQNPYFLRTPEPPKALQELFAHSNGVRKRPRVEPADEPAGSSGAQAALTAEQVRGMRVGELRGALRQRGLNPSGLKAALVARLEATLD